MSVAVLTSAAQSNFKRHLRSPALWFILLAAPVAAPFLISETEGKGVSVTVGNQLPVLTSPVMGIWLGIVISVLIMPVVYIALRAGPTRKAPWQITELTPASSVSLLLGRWIADAGVVALVLVAFALSGVFLGWMRAVGSFEPFVIVGLLWLVAAPTLLVVAALRQLMDARPALRGAGGDVLFFVFWLAMLILGIVGSQSPSALGANLLDTSGAIRPLIEAAPEGSDAFAIGSSQIQPGRVQLDVWRGIAADGYLASRALWLLLAAGIVVLSIE